MNIAGFVRTDVMANACETAICRANAEIACETAHRADNPGDNALPLLVHE